MPTTDAETHAEHLVGSSHAGFTEVPLYPSSGFRRLLLALEQVTSKKDVEEVLYDAGLGEYAANYPRDDATPGVPFSDYSAFGRAMEHHFGAKVRDIQMKVGEQTILGDQEQTVRRKVATGALMLIPPPILVRRTIESLVEDANEIGVPADWQERENHYLYIVSLCPYCFGRRTNAGCNALAGVIRASLRLATRKTYRVEEVTCRGRGDDTCSYEISKTPLE